VIQLVDPMTEAEWSAYHDIRRRVLFEDRGRFGIYEESHPDEYATGNHPKIAKIGGRAIGVIRIDIAADAAHFRRVAIDKPYQRKGYGTQMLLLAEKFVSDNGLGLINSSVDRAAVPFYEKCGYVVSKCDEELSSVPMHKTLSGNT
jgi:GNAT superfamily N-acetyltransferase